MAKGVRFHEVGAPEVLRWESVEVGGPGRGEVRIRHLAVGLNFADIYFRTGLYPAALPAGMGVEAAGVIEAVGPGVTGFAVGDRVTYTGSPLGAYSTERVMDAAPLIRLPDTISFEIDHTTSPSTTNTLGTKGVGEAGTIASTPAVVNAVLDAVRQFGVEDITMPCTPERVWKAIHTARAGGGETQAAAMPHFDADEPGQSSTEGAGA